VTTRYIFHLSIPVSDLDVAARFYTRVLQGRVGRQDRDWLDILLWGHQITLQHRPGEVLPLASQGKRHFGVTLPWREWEALATHIGALEVSWLDPPKVLFQGTPEEQGKFYLADPGNNVIEVKTYRHPLGTIGQGDEAYGYPEN
jgi:extradiol dioxygenase family protein